MQDCFQWNIIQKVEMDTFDVICINITTTNKNNQSSKDMAKLWQKFSQQDSTEQIPDRMDNKIIQLYSDYERDFSQPYQATLGFRVTKVAEIPAGWVHKSVNKQTYLQLKTIGSIPESIIRAWKWIWSADLSLTFQTNFELYPPNYMTERNPEILIYLSTKSR